MGKKLIAITLLTLSCSVAGSRPPTAGPSTSLAPYIDSIPGTLVTFTMVPVPGNPPFWIGKTEVSWDEYDVFAYNLDEPAARAGDTNRISDATARPSKPYGAPDYGWGHQGYPAISIAAPAAAEYAAWLSARTGKRYRLATDEEWTRAANAALSTLTLGPALLDSLAWHAGNSNRRAHPVAARRADGLGLYDMLGNAAEWVTGADGRPLTRGGSWADPAAQLGPTTTARPTSAWQERDPQFPKSRWWLSDGPFVGFRLVREPQAPLLRTP